MKHLIHIPLIFCAILAAIPATALELPWRKQDGLPILPPRPVVTEIPTPQAGMGRVIPGHIAASTEVPLGFLTLGRLTERGVELGDTVTEGQVLARLDPEDLDGEARAAEAAVTAAQAQYDTALLTTRRTRELAKRNVASTVQLEQVENALIAAEAALLQAQSQLIRARDQQKFAEITAPFDGIITAIRAEPGEVIEAGVPVVTLSGANKREAVIDVTAAEIADLPDDSLWTVWQESNPEDRYQASMERLSPLADTRTRTRRLRLALPPEAPFRLGALIRASRSHQDASALSLPESAILMLDGQAKVWLIRRPANGSPDQGIATLVDVETGPGNGQQITVTGLPEGAEVAVRGIYSLTEGQIVGQRIAP